MLQRNWTHRADLHINMNLDGRAAVISIAHNLKLVWSTVAPAILQTSFEQPTGGKQSPFHSTKCVKRQNIQTVLHATVSLLRLALLM